MEFGIALPEGMETLAAAIKIVFKRGSERKLDR